MLKLLGAIVVIMAAQGCTTLRRYVRPGEFTYPTLSQTYQNVSLRHTSSLDIIRMAQSPSEPSEQDLSSHQFVVETGNVVASFGQSPDTYTHWFSLFSVNPYDMTAQRKFFYLFNEKATASPFADKRYLTPRRVLVLEAELLMGDVLKLAYNNENTRRIAFLNETIQRLRQDVEVMTAGSEGPTHHYHALASDGMFANQVLQQALRRLNQFPVLARKLTTDEGVEFTPVSLDKGWIWIKIEQDIVHLTVEVGL